MHPLLDVTVHAVPVPARPAVSAAPDPSETSSVADFLPAGAMGPNVTSIVQLAPPGRVVESHPSVAPEAAENSAAFVPVTEKETGPLGAVPLFVTVNVNGAVVVPIETLPYPCLFGVRCSFAPLAADAGGPEAIADTTATRTSPAARRNPTLGQRPLIFEPPLPGSMAQPSGSRHRPCPSRRRSPQNGTRDDGKNPPTSLS